MHYHSTQSKGLIYILLGVFLLFLFGGFLLWRLIGILFALGLIRRGFILAQQERMFSQIYDSFIHIKYKFFK